MSVLSAFGFPGELTRAALGAVNLAAGVHASMTRFDAVKRLDDIPDEIDAAIAQLQALKAGVGDLRQAAGLPRTKPKPETTTEGDD